MSELMSFVNRQLPNLISDLEQLVNMDTPSHNKQLIDQAMEVVTDRFRKLIGGVVEIIPQKDHGNQVKLRLGQVVGQNGKDGQDGQDRRDGQILIMTHLDTVFPEGEAARRPFSNDGRRLYGPGVLDMKSGLLQGLYAMYAVTSLYQPKKDIVLFVNTDEEIASTSSRQHIEEEARKSDAVFVLEPALGAEGKLKTARKGVGRYTIQVEGIAAHSGVDHKSGVNALEELAHQILYLQSLTNYELGSTVNVGKASGGTAFNVVSSDATADLEVRVETLEEMERMRSLITSLSPKLERAKVTVTGGMVRPPMEKKMSQALFEDAKQIAGELGFDLNEAATGGASDGNFTAALGIPTLDGLGAVGTGLHAPDEYAELDQIVPRTALLAELIKKHSC